MKNSCVTIPSLAVCLLAACAEEPLPVSVNEFVENPRLLEATMVRCGQNRTEMKYEAECVNARDAVNRLLRAEEAARREALEAQSEKKREALRRTQEAAAAARRRAAEEQRRREEEQYLGVFEDLPKQDAEPAHPESSARQDNAPGAHMEEAPAAESPQATTAPGEPTAVDEPTATGSPTDLGAVREELKRRQESDINPLRK